MTDRRTIMNEITADPVAAFIEHGGGDDDTALQELPNHMRGGIVRYVLLGIPTGSFLKAVFSFDDEFAAHKAGSRNLPHLDAFFEFVENECPADCQGSADVVGKWSNQNGLLQLEQSDD
jgi:hypothetical protein